MDRPIAWTIAGSDNSAFAGIQADLAAFTQCGIHGCSVITTITAQNNQSLENYFLPYEHILSQIDALQHHFPPKAIKIGMLGNLLENEKMLDFLERYVGPIVLDPVMFSTSGSALFTHSLEKHLSQMRQLYPLIDLITPNLPEAEKMVGTSLSSYLAIEQAAKSILHLGVKSVLIKGGHFKKGPFSQDYWTNGTEAFWITQPRYINRTRGTGCTLSSAITAALAKGYDIKDAIVIGKIVVSRKIGLKKAFPYITQTPLYTFPLHFPPIPPIGLYPVVNNSGWLKQLLPLGIKTIQLRMKNSTQREIEAEIGKSIALAKQYRANLFINDDWERAIHYGAPGVHLGQSDLLKADVESILAAGLQLGISTHNYYEVACAHAYHPSYMACGPIFHTTSKVMPFAPQGLRQLIAV